jgi:hypothetical protein
LYSRVEASLPVFPAFMMRAVYLEDKLGDFAFLILNECGLRVKEKTTDEDR